jgi:hypothetical protein
MSEVVSYEQARDEVNGWLDYKKVKEKKREAYKDAIDTLVDGVKDGTLSIAEDMKITHALAFPVEDSTGKIVFDKLEYKARLSVGEIGERTKGVKAADTDGRIMAHVSALTGKAIGLLNKMDTEDNSIAQSIAVFFV